MAEEFAAYGLPAWSVGTVGVVKVSAAIGLLVGLFIPKPYFLLSRLGVTDARSSCLARENKRSACEIRACCHRLAAYCVPSLLLKQPASIGRRARR